MLLLSQLRPPPNSGYAQLPCSVVQHCWRLGLLKLGGWCDATPGSNTAVPWITSLLQSLRFLTRQPLAVCFTVHLLAGSDWLLALHTAVHR
jgi:hypothetical protein